MPSFLTLVSTAWILSVACRSDVDAWAPPPLLALTQYPPVERRLGSEPPAVDAPPHIATSPETRSRNYTVRRLEISSPKQWPR
jgi:hypothetical protein